LSIEKSLEVTNLFRSSDKISKLLENQLIDFLEVTANSISHDLTFGKILSTFFIILQFEGIFIDILSVSVFKSHVVESNHSLLQQEINKLLNVINITIFLNIIFTLRI